MAVWRDTTNLDKDSSGSSIIIMYVTYAGNGDTPFGHYEGAKRPRGRLAASTQSDRFRWHQHINQAT